MVTFLFHSIETERELCRLLFYHLHTAGVFPFCFHSIPYVQTRQYTTPMPIDCEVQKNSCGKPNFLSCQ